MNKNAVIYWFSGTGNTEKVAKEYKKNFEENKIFSFNNYGFIYVFMHK